MEVFRSLKSTTVPPGHFIGEGHKVVRRMLALSIVEKILLTPEWRSELGDAISPKTEVLERPRDELREIVGFKMHQGVIALGRIPAPPEDPPNGLVVALDGISDAENVGAILRSCAAFGVDGVIVGPGTCSPWVRRAVRVSLGAPLKVPIHASDDLSKTIRELEFPSYAAHIHGDRTNLGDLDLSPPCCLVLGGEADGVTPPVIEACRAVVYIPMAEGWDCLNVAASASVLLYEARRR